METKNSFQKILPKNFSQKILPKRSSQKNPPKKLHLEAENPFGLVVQKSCFLGARELVRRKVKIHAYWLPLTKENLFHRLRNWNLNAFHDVEARDLLQGISFQNVFFQPTNRIRNESWILRSPWMSICTITYFGN